jgi:hypothetical protein
LWRGGNFLENLEENKNEELGVSILHQIMRKHVGNIVKLFFEKKLVITKVEILHGFGKIDKIKR